MRATKAAYYEVLHSGVMAATLDFMPHVTLYAVTSTLVALLSVVLSPAAVCGRQVGVDKVFGQSVCDCVERGSHWSAG